MSEPTVLSAGSYAPRLSSRAEAKRAGAEFDVSVHSRLADVAGAWRDLEATGAAGVFQRLDVFQAWTETIAAGRAEWFVVTVRLASCGRMVMLLPLCLRRDNGIRLIEGADLEVSDFLAPVVSHDFRPAPSQMRAIWAEVLRQLPPADMVSIAKMPPMIGDVPNPMLLLRGVEAFHLSNLRTRLGEGAASFEERIPQKFRADLAARRRKLGKRGRVTFQVAETDAEAERFFEVMVAQRAERCRAMERGNILEDQGYRDFYRSLIRPRDRDSIGVMQALLVDDEVVATGYGLNAGSSFLMIFPTFASQTWRNYSPGMQLFVESMRWAEGRGMAWYDFTIGGEGFKRDLAAEATPLFELLAARSLRGVPRVLAARARARLRQSSSVRALFRRIRGSKAG